MWIVRLRRMRRETVSVKVDAPSERAARRKALALEDDNAVEWNEADGTNGPAKVVDARKVD